MRGASLSEPTGKKPYKKYRAARLRTRHASDGLGLAQEVAKAEGRQPAGKKGATAKPSRPQPAFRRRFRWRYLVLAIAVPLLIAAAVAGVWAYKGYGQFDEAVKRSNRRIDRATRRALTPDAGSLFRHPTTVLVLGSDAREDEPSRSDSIMLLRFNPKTHTVSQLSIARDTLTAVAGHGETKINEALFYGGAPLAIRTVRQFTGIPINHIMLVRFRGFRRLINGVGGLTINVPEDISSEYTGGRVVHF